MTFRFHPVTENFARDRLAVNSLTLNRAQNALVERGGEG